MDRDHSKNSGVESRGIAGKREVLSWQEEICVDLNDPDRQPNGRIRIVCGCLRLLQGLHIGERLGELFHKLSYDGAARFDAVY